ncbi:MAG: HAMP domain-containing histidine kinase, partial [Lachnospiraceae bacterium]|nr:HAMP domain-containing histidine kinase [Lachnospiraceae bacterium]
LIPPMGIIIAAVFFLSAILSGKVSDNILKPLYELDIEHPGEKETYEELKPLTQRIEYQNRKLKEKIYDEMEKRNRKRNEFTTNMTHELKTPLTSVSGFAELMMKEGMDQELIKDFSRSIYDETARMISLVEDIIKLEEMDERMESYEFEEVDLNDIAKEVCEHLRIAASQKGVKVKLSEGEAIIYGTRSIVFEMLYNLCDNAIKYNVEGGSIDIKTYTDREGVFFDIWDTGIGIPPEEQELVFDRFYRVDKSRSRGLGGTGLGLSIVRQGVILHSGDIKIISNEGEGTRIILRFPALKDQ